MGLFGQSLRCVKQKGKILVIGFARREGDLENIAVNMVLLKQAQVIGYVSSLPSSHPSNNPTPPQKTQANCTNKEKTETWRKQPSIPPGNAPDLERNEKAVKRRKVKTDLF